jgi:hypothetical protein
VRWRNGLTAKNAKNAKKEEAFFSKQQHLMLFFAFFASFAVHVVSSCCWVSASPRRKATRGKPVAAATRGLPPAFFDPPMVSTVDRGFVPQKLLIEQLARHT